MNKIINVVFFVLLSLSFNLIANELQAAPVNQAETLEIEVYRSPTCGCCSKWIKHLQENNFVVKDFVTNDVQVIKDKYGVPGEMASCHTAVVNGYVVEGHVPAADIRELLKMKSNVIGVSVPGMPVGTPGMDMGGRKDPYQVVSFDRAKNFEVVKSYEGK